MLYIAFKNLKSSATRPKKRNFCRPTTGKIIPVPFRQMYIQVKDQCKQWPWFVVGAIYWSLDSNGQTHAFVSKRTLKKNAISSIFILSYEIGWEWWQPTMSPHAKKRANRVPLCKFRRVIQPDGCWSRPRMRSSSFTISKTFTFVNFSKSSTTCRTVLKLLQQWK